jgi:hypothetical protein
VDLIEDGIFDRLRFHRCSAYESGCPAMSQEGRSRILY